MRDVMRLCGVALVLLAAAHAGPGRASEHAVSYIPDLRPVGAGRLSVFMVDIYDAALWAPHGKWKPGDPLSLQLTYLREIKGDRIADRSVEEMRKTAAVDEVRLAAWHAQLRDIFPDVRAGTTLTGVLTPGGETVFLQGDREIGQIKDRDFGKAFFGIWLGEKTSTPHLRRQLLGSS